MRIAGDVFGSPKRTVETCHRRRERAGKIPADELEAAVSERVEAQKYADGAPVERSYHGSGDFRVMKYRL